MIQMIINIHSRSLFVVSGFILIFPLINGIVNSNELDSVPIYIDKYHITGIEYQEVTPQSSVSLANSSSGKELSKSTAKKRESTPTVIASLKAHYDDWGEDSALIESGSQYTELVSALFIGHHIRQDFDSLAVSFEGGIAQADVSRLGQRSQLSSPLDTSLRSCPAEWCKSVALYAAPGG